MLPSRCFTSTESEGGRAALVPRLKPDPAVSVSRWEDWPLCDVLTGPAAAARRGLEEGGEVVGGGGGGRACATLVLPTTVEEVEEEEEEACRDGSAGRLEMPDRVVSDSWRLRGSPAMENSAECLRSVASVTVWAPRSCCGAEWSFSVSSEH